MCSKINQFNIFGKALKILLIISFITLGNSGFCWEKPGSIPSGKISYYSFDEIRSGKYNAVKVNDYNWTGKDLMKFYELWAQWTGVEVFPKEYLEISMDHNSMMNLFTDHIGTCRIRKPTLVKNNHKAGLTFGVETCLPIMSDAGIMDNFLREYGLDKDLFGFPERVANLEKVNSANTNSTKNNNGSDPNSNTNLFWTVVNWMSLIIVVITIIRFVFYR